MTRKGLQKKDHILWFADMKVLMRVVELKWRSFLYRWFIHHESRLHFCMSDAISRNAPSFRERYVLEVESFEIIYWSPIFTNLIIQLCGFRALKAIINPQLKKNKMAHRKTRYPRPDLYRAKAINKENEK